VPSADILIESPVESSFRVQQVRGMFDVPDADVVKHEWHVEMPCEEKPWKIGLIVGPSGSGKTTIGKRLFPDALFHEGYDWPETAALIDGFPKELGAADITKALSSVGFSSPPHWLKRFNHLSNGQKFRCELARVMLEEADTVIFDEWTSVVDRDAAQVASSAVAKALRKNNGPRLVALSCHFDVIDWLNPDWVYNVASGEYHWRSLQQRPAIELRIHKAGTDAWKIFQGHHYLTKSLHKAARCFVATWRDKPVAFTSFINFCHSKVSHTKREHRTVVLPDYQGVGIGNAVSEWLGAFVTASGYRFQSTTSHPAMIRHRHKSPLWVVKRIGHVAAPGRKPSRNHSARAIRAGASTSRVTAGCEYIGPALTDLAGDAKALCFPKHAAGGAAGEGLPEPKPVGLTPKGRPRRKASLTGRHRPTRQTRRSRR
jgi:GNAT superfamily N-acetyltransferase